MLHDHKNVGERKDGRTSFQSFILGQKYTTGHKIKRFVPIIVFQPNSISTFEILGFSLQLSFIEKSIKVLLDHPLF